MKKIYPYRLGLLLVGVSVCYIGGVPSVTAAASSKPTCELSVAIAGVTTDLHGSSPLLVQLDTPMSITWESARATKAVDQSGYAVALSGMVTVTPDRSMTYAYKFSRGSVRTSCTVPVVVVKGSVTAQPRGVVGAKPIIAGRAKGVTMVTISLTPSGTTTPFYVSDTLRVRNGKWTGRVSKSLPDGLYQVTVNGSGKQNSVVIATSTLQVGIVSAVSASAPLVVVVPIPLLIGGVAHPGTSVAVAYLQVINIGTATATLEGFTLTQTGTAPLATVVGLTAVTDNGVARGTAGNMLTGTPFVGASAFIPLIITLAPREMRLVTIKAVMSPLLVPYLGSTLTLRVSGVTGTLRPHAAFPLFGTVWTMGS